MVSGKFCASVEGRDLTPSYGVLRLVSVALIFYFDLFFRIAYFRTNGSDFFRVNASNVFRLANSPSYSLYGYFFGDFSNAITPLRDNGCDFSDKNAVNLPESGMKHTSARIRTAYINRNLISIEIRNGKIKLSHRGTASPTKEIDNGTYSIQRQNVLKSTESAKDENSLGGENAFSVGGKSRVVAKKGNYALGDIDVGLVKFLDRDIVLELKSIFALDAGTTAEGDAKYRSYTAAAARRLLSEFSSSGYNGLANLFSVKWQKLNNVAICRGYRILLMEHMNRKKFDTLIMTFVSIVGHPFLLDAYMFDIATKISYRTYIDGWLMSILLLATFKSYGLEFFRKVPVFSGSNEYFNFEGLELEPKISKICKFVNFKPLDSNVSRKTAIEEMYNNVLYACFHGRVFKNFISLYCEKLSVSNALNFPLQKNFRCKFETASMELIPESPTQKSHSFYDMILQITSINLSSSVDHDIELVERDLASTKGMNVVANGNNNGQEWHLILMLKHALYNYFSSTDIQLPSANCTDEPHGTTINDLFDATSSLTDVSEQIKKYFSVLSGKRLFGPKRKLDACSVDDFAKVMEKFESSGSTDLLDTIVKLAKVPIGSTFLKKAGGMNTQDNCESLNDIMREIRKYNGNKEIEVRDIYSFLRRLVNYDISGFIATHILLSLVPSLKFHKWIHYHIFSCAFEADIERGDLDSLDKLLGFMTLLGSRPEPGTYARFFALCNIREKHHVVWRHFYSYMNCKDANPRDSLDKYGIRNMRRVSLEMYNNVFSSCIQMGEYAKGLIALKQMLSDLEGMYRRVGPRTWDLIKKIASNSKVDSKLMALIKQCELLSSAVPTDNIMRPTVINVPKYDKSVIVQQMESLIDKHLSSNSC